MANDTSGWFDPLIANKAYIDFANDAPRYGRLQKPDVIDAMTQAYYRLGGCSDLLQGCSALGNSSVSNGVCYAADVFCVSDICLLHIRVIWLFHFSGKTSKDPQARDIMNMISGRRIHLRPVPMISSRNTSTQHLCGQPSARKSPLCFRQTLLKLCLILLAMWFLLFILVISTESWAGRSIRLETTPKPRWLAATDPYLGRSCYALSSAWTYIASLRLVTLTSSTYTLINHW